MSANIECRLLERVSAAERAILLELLQKARRFSLRLTATRSTPACVSRSGTGLSLFRSLVSYRSRTRPRFGRAIPCDRSRCCAGVLDLV